MRVRIHHSAGNASTGSRGASGPGAPRNMPAKRRRRASRQSPRAVDSAHLRAALTWHCFSIRICFCFLNFARFSERSKVSARSECSRFKRIELMETRDSPAIGVASGVSGVSGVAAPTCQNRANVRNQSMAAKTVDKETEKRKTKKKTPEQ